MPRRTTTAALLAAATLAGLGAQTASAVADSPVTTVDGATKAVMTFNRAEREARVKTLTGARTNTLAIIVPQPARELSMRVTDYGGDDRRTCAHVTTAWSGETFQLVGYWYGSGAGGGANSYFFAP